MSTQPHTAPRTSPTSSTRPLSTSSIPALPTAPASTRTTRPTPDRFRVSTRWNGARTHFDGPVVAGGSDYDLSELLSARSPVMLPTGLPLLDEFTGGIEQGSMWTIAGVAGIGVSSLALTIAANAASAGEVIVCNGLHRQLGRATRRHRTPVRSFAHAWTRK